MKNRAWIFLGSILVLFVIAGCGAEGDGSGSSTHTVGGTVGGLTGTVVLQLNGGSDLTISEDGSFAFPDELTNGASYTVTVKTQPSGRICSIANASGTIDGADVTSVYVIGQLDPAFGTDGVATSSGAAGGVGDTLGLGMVIDGSGRILVTGKSKNASGNFDMVVWRYDSDGTLDSTFGTGGIAKYNHSANRDDGGNAIAIDGSGQILVVGAVTNGAGNLDMAIWRLTSAGLLDTTFSVDGDGANGVAIYSYSGYSYSNDEGRAVVLDGTDILVAGSIQNPGNNYDMAIWRYNSAGSRVAAFGSSGIVVFSGGYGNDAGNSIALASDGDIVVAGVSANVSGNLDMALWRYTSLGVKDSLFGGVDGLVLYNGTYGNDAGNSLHIDGSGRILVTGYSRNSSGNDDMVIWRYTATGVLDISFATTGLLRNDSAAGGSGDDHGFFITQDASGRVIVAGTSADPSGDYDMVVWRCSATGVPDATFGTGGVVVYDNAAVTEGIDAGSAVAMDEADANKRILVAGYSMNASDNYDMALWRYYPN